jgi:uncharacterized protein (TIGR00162 family)
MKETFTKETTKIEPKNAVLIEGLPGMGMVGRIATRYLIKELGAKRFAELYSPHFPYYVLVNKKGDVRLLRGEFYFWNNQNGENDLIILTGDSQAQTIEGQYEVTKSILNFAHRLGVKKIVTLGGYRQELLKEALESKAITSPTGNPIVGTAGLLLGLAKFTKIDALCLLGETRGYLPDPKAARSVIEILQRILNFHVDFNGLDKEIEKSNEIVARMKEIEKRRESYAKRMRQTEKARVTYIS